MFKVYVKQSLQSLSANKTRTLLTTLGIIIGIATIILVVSTGQGFKSYINSQVESFGVNTLFIETSVPSTTKARSESAERAGGESQASQSVPITTLKNRDISDIKRLPHIVDAYGAVLSQQIVAYKSVSKNSFIFGSDAGRFVIDKGVLALGRGFDENEVSSLAQVAVLGSKISRDLFGDNNPLNQTIRVGAYNFIVIGVYEERGSVGPSNDDDQVFIPVTTLQKKIMGIDYLFYVIAAVDDNSQSEIVADDIKTLLRRNHGIRDPLYDDFKVSTQAQSLGTFDTILSATTLLLILIAAISLVVGGVGVMNIMYVAVTERTSEVGLKKALGARNKDILYEFLIESLLLTLLGGIIGIILGTGLSFVVSRIAESFGFAWDFVVPIRGILLGLIFSGSIGIIFGVLPARNAAKLDPITALQYE